MLAGMVARELSTLPPESIEHFVSCVNSCVNHASTVDASCVNNCSFCGKPFVSSKKWAAFCTNSCRTMAYRLRSKDLAEPEVAQVSTSAVDASCVSAKGGLGGSLPEKAQPSKEGAAKNGHHGQSALFDTAVERAKPKGKTEKKFPPMPPDLAADAKLVEAWDRWVKHRKEMGKPITPTGQAQSFAEFTKIGPAASVAMIDYTIFKGWQGLQPAPIEIRGGGAKPARERPSVDVTKLQRPEGE